MILRGWGQRTAALALCFVPFLAQAEELLISRGQTGEILATLHMENGDVWKIIWNHSVDGYEVEDIYENRFGSMVLIRSHQPDFGAGLGHIPGRGQQISDGIGGYWIENIDEPVPGNSYVLRAGAISVNHRLSTSRMEISLTAIAARERLRLTLRPDSK